MNGEIPTRCSQALGIWTPDNDLPLPYQSFKARGRPEVLSMKVLIEAACSSVNAEGTVAVDERSRSK